MKKHSTAVREAQSRELISSFFGGEEIGFGLYDLINDRSNYAPVSRYLRGESPLKIPSPFWTYIFVQSGGRFDSCGVWGIHPNTGVHLEGLGIPPEFAGRNFALLGRADFDFSHVAEVYNEGFDPQTRAEFHACVRGMERQIVAQKAWAIPKSTLRLGWMSEVEFYHYILETSARVVGEGLTQRHSFNGVPMYGEDEKFLSDERFLKNPVFANWVNTRSSRAEMSRRNWSHTSVGKVRELSGGRLLLQREKKTEIFLGRKLGNISVAKVAGVWFIWNPQNGFQTHMENPSLKEAVRLWENRSRRGEPRPLSLNDVRNDMSGTAGFCLAGTKSFLRDKMPFVYRLISQYASWEEIPAEILSTKWEVDWKVFQGYPVP